MDLIEFEWGRCIDGYRLEGGYQDRNVVAVSERFEIYRPNELPVLFQIFADAAATEEGALDFVNKFGAIGGIREIRQRNEEVQTFLESHAQLRQAIHAADTHDWTILVELYNTNTFGRGQLISRLRHQRGGTVALVFVPTNLIQFLWLQFALHVSSDAKLLRCERCGVPFRVGTGTGRRETAKYCSNACKVAAFRSRTEGRQEHA